MSNLGREHYRKLAAHMAKLGAPHPYRPAVGLRAERRKAEAKERQKGRRRHRTALRKLNGRSLHGRQLHAPAPHLVTDPEATPWAAAARANERRRYAALPWLQSSI